MSLLGVDLGTSGCKAAVFSEDGRRLSLAFREYATIMARPGWMELDAQEVWAKTMEVIREAAGLATDDPVSALSVSSMGEALVPLSRDRRILGRSILGSDARGEEEARRFFARISAEDFHRINPNIPGPNFSMPKLAWLRDHEPELFRRADHFLHYGDAVLFLLGAEAVSDLSLANRTLLLDIRAEDWSDRLLDLAGLSRDKLGRCVPCGAAVGRISGAMARELGLPAGVTLVSGGHDQALCALGAGCTEAGSAVCGLGTFACLTPVFDRIPGAAETLPAGICVEHHVLPGRYVSFLFNQSGSLVTWFRSACAAGSDGQDAQDLYRRLFAEMPEGPGSLIALPTFEPLQFPAYAGDVSGAILGLGPGTTRGGILKALLEGAAYYFLPGLDTLRRFGIQTREFVATGGGSRSDAWLQLEADVFGTPFVRLENEEAGLAGAAMLAGLGTGRFADPSEAARRFVHRGRTFEPDAGRHAAYRERAACFRTILDTLRPAFPALRAFRTGDKRD